MAPKINRNNNSKSHFSDCLVLDRKSLYFISDLHINGHADPKIKLLENFLSGLASSKTPVALFILGDLFDFWISDHAYLRKQYGRVISAMQTFIANGHQIFYFEGNHDLHLKKFWEDKMGIKVFSGPVLLESFGKKIGVEHGDQMDPSDRGYIVLRWILRTLPMRAIAAQLPGSLLDKLGRELSAKSRTYTDRTKKARNKRFADVIKKHLTWVTKLNPMDLHVSGHVHEFINDELIVNGKPLRVVNLGWWGDRPRAFHLNEAGISAIEL